MFLLPLTCCYLFKLLNKCTVRHSIFFIIDGIILFFFYIMPSVRPSSFSLFHLTNFCAIVFPHLQERNVNYSWYSVLVIVLLEQLEGRFSCSFHNRARALKHVKLSLLVPSAARAFRDFAEETFLASSVEPAIKIFCGNYDLSISEFITGLTEACQ